MSADSSTPTPLTELPNEHIEVEHLQVEMTTGHMGTTIEQLSESHVAVSAFEHLKFATTKETHLERYRELQDTVSESESMSMSEDGVSFIHEGEAIPETVRLQERFEFPSPVDVSSSEDVKDAISSCGL